MEHAAKRLPSIVKPIPEVIDHRHLDKDDWCAVFGRTCEVKMELCEVKLDPVVVQVVVVEIELDWEHIKRKLSIFLELVVVIDV
jgi:hypothetical protein